MKLVFATGNPNKVMEVNDLLGDLFDIQSLKDIGCQVDIPETQATIEGNAIQKAQYIVDHYAMNCFSEDTGLEVKALNNEPGIYSARYAGAAKNAEDNMNLLLKNLSDQTDRSAQFRTVVALYLNGNMHTFEGICKGKIIEQKKGDHGFGYDPIFVPEGYGKTFAELDKTTKNEISHRGKAVRKLIAFLKENS